MAQMQYFEGEKLAFMKNDSHFRKRLSIARMLLYCVFITSEAVRSASFSMTPKNDDNEVALRSPLSQLSRRQILASPFAIGGAIAYGKSLSDVAKKISRGDLEYPPAHEKRVESTIANAMVAAVPSFLSEKNTNRPFRVLEIGIGDNCRVSRRGLYDEAFEELSKRGVSNIALTGLDIVVPKSNVMAQAENRLNKNSSGKQMKVNFDVLEGSIESKSTFSNGWFDCVVCALTLCSVDNQVAALEEVKRVLRPNGGTFGFVEHVAVNIEEPYRILNLQQQVFDPLQQVVAHNCHLHRYTGDNILKVFSIQKEEDYALSSRLSYERFLVDDMWPVSSQCCGVIQRNS